MPIPSALQSRIRQWIGVVEVVEATGVSITIPRPVGAKFGPKGRIGTFKGQAMSRVDVTFAQVEGKSQFETHVSQLADFVYTYTKGSSKFQLRHCELGDGGIRGEYESGDTSVTATFIGDGPYQIA